MSKRQGVKEPLASLLTLSTANSGQTLSPVGSALGWLVGAVESGLRFGISLLHISSPHCGAGRRLRLGWDEDRRRPGRALLDRGTSVKGVAVALDLSEPGSKMGSAWMGWDGELPTCLVPREPGAMVMTVGSKVDGVLVGTDGRYSSMAAGFRSSEHKNAYENVLEEEEGRVRSTPM